MVIEIPEGYVVSENENVLGLLASRVAQYPDQKLIEYKQNDQFLSITAREFDQKVTAVAKGLISLGLDPRSKVAIASRTRFEWVLLDFAIFKAGCITVPIYETSSTEQIRHILSDAQISIAFVENAQMAEKFKTAGASNMRIFENGAVDELIALGENIADSQLDIRVTDTKAESIASIVYTSGSTGTPKGVIINHKAYVAVCRNAGIALPDVLLAQNTKLLLFLPLAHGFARMVALTVITSNNAVLGLSPDVKELLGDLKTFKPTVLLGVPRIFEKVYNAASHKAGKGIGKQLFQRAAKAAIDWSMQLDQEKRKVTNVVQKTAFDPILYRKIRNVLGGKVQFCVSGGAPLNPRLAHFFRGAGINILEGFGMTETVAPICVNRPENNRIGSIGLPLPGVVCKLAEDNELLINSPFNFLEYNNLPGLSAETLLNSLPDDTTDSSGQTEHLAPKWIASGDLAKIDEDGFIYIIGRKKDIIVTAGGKNVSPVSLESVIDMSELVQYSVVIGDGMPFISALITLDEEGVKNWAERQNRPELTIAEAVSDPAVWAEIRRVIDNANNCVSRAESIRKFVILDKVFSQDDGTITQSLKIRRQEIARLYQEDINKMYRKS
jgi:long-chain acyl-CoA synthetase